MPVNQSFFTIVGTGPVFGNQSISDVQFGTKDIIARDLDVGKLSPVLYTEKKDKMTKSDT